MTIKYREYDIHTISIFMTKLSTTPPGGGCTGHIVKPANTHDLMIITTNIKDVLIH